MNAEPFIYLLNIGVNIKHNVLTLTLQALLEMLKKVSNLKWREF